MEIYQNLSLEDLPNEVWKFIPLTDELYMISNMGRVKSVDSVRVYPNYKRKCKSKIRKQFPNWQGYLSCYVTNKKGDRILIRPHKVVCDVFIPNPNNYPCVNHKDENKQNNRVENLEHCTYSYNITYGSRKGERDVAVLQYDLDGNFIKEHKSVKDAAKEVGAHRNAISNAVHGCAKSAGGYMWRLKEEASSSKLESYTDKNKRKVICYDLQENPLREYNSIVEASRALGLWAQDISNCCRGKKKKVKEYIFRYK